MDALSKTAVTEISKLVEIESKMLKIEITRGRNEIASLTEKLQLMEKLLYMAQGNRQEVVLPTAARDSPCLASNRTRPLIQSMSNSSETVWEKISSSPETNSFYHNEDHTATESEKELPKLRVIKEEPPDLDNSYTDQDQTAEIGVEAFTDIQKSPEVTQSTKSTVEHHQPLFTDDIMTLSQQSLPKPWSTETHWSSQLPAAKTNPGAGEIKQPHQYRASLEKMMCDNTNRSFRAQLAVILDKLTKAALVEISNLADECSSVLRTEISLHKTENEALKKRCYSLEVQLSAAREAQTYPADANNSVSCRQPTDQQHCAPAIEGVFGKDWCMDLWREERLPPQRRPPMDVGLMGSTEPQVIDMMAREPDLIFVKEESYDDHPISQQLRHAGSRKIVGMCEDDGMLHRAVNEMQLSSGEQTNFPMTSDSQMHQRTQQPIVDKLLDDATMSTLVDNTNLPSAALEHSDYTNSLHMNTTKEFALQPKPLKTTKRFELLQLAGQTRSIRKRWGRS
ncbi:hypothetical protein OJAV_G00079930 [Oryzias javanicus]|uniref:Uncharacterized protein n=1 Tax=Oryzias javanicus TaxID=123683 RepID=A0A437D3I5_ORYJA|nr:hypothetical protein OJAV_G00079930 [Oryzias javanicus]